MYFHYYFLLKKSVALHLNKPESLHQRIFCVKFGREWPGRFYTLEKISKVCHGIFAVSLLSSLGKDCGPSFV